MQVQLTFVVLLCLVCNGLSSDVDEGKDAMEEEMLSSLFTSESRHSAPMWPLPLLNMCRMLGSISEATQDWNIEEIQTAYEQRLTTALSQTLQDLYNLKLSAEYCTPESSTMMKNTSNWTRTAIAH